MKSIINRLTIANPATVIEIGCGSELIINKWIQAGNNPDLWIIVEPAKEFSEKAVLQNLKNICVIQDFFENAVEDIRSMLSGGADYIICSSLLHEVISSKRLLDSIISIMKPHTKLLINVPNSESFHRQLALSMGVISDTKQMSERNQLMQQHRVYDMLTLKDELTHSGLLSVQSGGYFIKPFTHSQMEKISSYFGQDIMDGLFELGKKIPEMASEIWVEAVLNVH